MIEIKQTSRNIAVEGLLLLIRLILHASLSMKHKPHLAAHCLRHAQRTHTYAYINFTNHLFAYMLQPVFKESVRHSSMVDMSVSSLIVNDQCSSGPHSTFEGSVGVDYHRFNILIHRYNPGLGSFYEKTDQITKLSRCTGSGVLAIHPFG